ncbi:glycerophosphodiester phosphodiesterase [Spirochaeta africana]|uniref:Glycerophosphoryl diester phosphodiesterase n=1 Tax=Spirochaeta africana (strain ATCC 700263 / DSM 8902 / Z-7692) TaxID=889378 RepID=H9UMM1_SPIAZ|nr:glycerophosphodiester phosphodiesterase family protein [Spirochaeta africana]AFG38764.1 glycerophosphoryl diester phosphodiesterase [Spirochaeta africana DSM 8902]
MHIPRGFSSHQLPLLFAHRGLRTGFPENTMAAFTAARQQQIPGIELDVHITADGKVVVVHDDDLTRVGNCPLVIEESRWDDLRRIDIGSHCSREFSAERIPLLEDVLATFGQDCYIDIELKNSVRLDRGLAAATAAVIRRVQPARPLLISSFNPLELKRFRTQMPELPTAAIYSRDAEVPWYLRSGWGSWIARTDGRKPKRDIVPERLAGILRRRWILPWTVNDAREGLDLLQRGAIGIVSDDPRPLMQLLRETSDQILPDAPSQVTKR